MPVYYGFLLFVVCFIIYAWLEAVIEKSVLNSCLFKLSKILEKLPVKVFIVTKGAGCRPLTLLKLTLSQISFKNSAKITHLRFRRWLINVQLTNRMYH